MVAVPALELARVDEGEAVVLRSTDDDRAVVVRVSKPLPVGVVDVAAVVGRR